MDKASIKGKTLVGAFLFQNRKENISIYNNIFFVDSEHRTTHIQNTKL